MGFALNRTERRAAESYMRAENAKWPEQMKEWPRDEWPESAASRAPNLLRVFRSRHFLVQEFVAPSPALVRLSVNRAAIAGDRWQDGISWEEMQAIKDQCGYADRDAVEVFPASVDVVNVANMRHLWVLSEPLSFKWTSTGGAA